ncbi:hypothetical protein [Bacteroides sp. 224]|uniref:HU family DNA-binding protein n=1 Tax=Bacteroides sp. 224 TaxID=2302936 RepID=UPI0013D530DC|nr:hypothetical protein [Bacteroides sp. 224]NDV66874.1 hypothetical protein [Bacteroides sp. 224]
MASIFTEKKEFILNLDKDKPTMFRIKTTKQQELSFEELLDEVSNACGVGRAQTKASVEGLLDRMTVFMNHGMIIRLGDFGSFRPAINVKAQKSADDLKVDNIRRRKIIFTPGKRFKYMLSNLSFRTIDDSVSSSNAGNGNSGSGNSGNGNSGEGDEFIDPSA